MLPSASISDIVRVVNQIQRQRCDARLIGGVFLLWTSLSLFSVLESAFNIVYGQPNRSFLHGKGVAVVLMLGTLVTLFVGLVIGTSASGCCTTRARRHRQPLGRATRSR